MDAGAPLHRGHHLPATALRQARRSAPARPALLPLAAGEASATATVDDPDRTHHRPRPAGLAEGRAGRPPTPRWRLVGTSVMISPVRLRLAPRSSAGARSPSCWACQGGPRPQHRPVGRLHGRPARAARPTCATSAIRNTVFLTGDIHMAWANDVPVKAGTYPLSALRRHGVRGHLGDLRQPRRHPEGRARTPSRRGRGRRSRPPTGTCSGSTWTRHGLRRPRRHRRARADGLLRRLRQGRPRRDHRVRAPTARSRAASASKRLTAL